MIRHPTLVALAGLEAAGALGTLDIGDTPAPKDAPRIRAHLADCGRCRERFGFVRAVRAAAAQASPEDAGPDLLDRIMARHAAGDRVILPVDEPVRIGARRIMPIAAAALLLIAVAVAAQLALRGYRQPQPEPSPPSPAEQEMAAPQRAAPVGIAVVPGPGTTNVRIAGTGEIQIDAYLHDGDELGVRGRGSAAAARFRAADDGIAITDVEGGLLELRVPRGAPARVFVNGRLEISSGPTGLRIARSDAVRDRVTLIIGRD